MVLNNIEKLLKKFENGETTLAEEQELKAYFSGEMVAPHLERYKPMFLYFSENKKEQFTKPLVLDARPAKIKPMLNFKWFWVAALAVITLGVYYLKTVNNNDLGTYNDPEIAFSEMTKALEKISNRLNKGASTLVYLNELNKGTAKLEYLNEMDRGIEIIFKN